MSKAIYFDTQTNIFSLEESLKNHRKSRVADNTPRTQMEK